ncbi:hypothetical protein [Massilia sp. TSP1-1-2]|uniref:hypothetical protein n=1 Tax=unclassified Massilia TaxID=2609279 RepID=UPI003CE8449A
MKTLRTIVIVSIGLIVALGWAVMPPRDLPVIGLPLEVSKQLQCPPGTALEGKLCMCPKGSNWTNGTCALGPEGPETRHVTTVDLRQRR